MQRPLRKILDRWRYLKYSALRSSNASSAGRGGYDPWAQSIPMLAAIDTCGRSPKALAHSVLRTATCLARLARGNMLFLQAILFQKPWR